MPMACPVGPGQPLLLLLSLMRLAQRRTLPVAAAADITTHPQVLRTVSAAAADADTHTGAAAGRACAVSAALMAVLLRW